MYQHTIHKSQYVELYLEDTCSWEAAAVIRVIADEVMRRCKLTSA